MYILQYYEVRIKNIIMQLPVFYYLEKKEDAVKFIYLLVLL